MAGDGPDFSDELELAPFPITTCSVNLLYISLLCSRDNPCNAERLGTTAVELNEAILCRAARTHNHHTSHMEPRLLCYMMRPPNFPLRPPSHVSQLLPFTTGMFQGNHMHLTTKNTTYPSTFVCFQGAKKY